ncbi:hypothetical protein C0J52_24186, partial [Blattella germanica]
PCHWRLDVHESLNPELPHHWIGSVGADNQALFYWPLRSPDLSPCGFYFWGYLKDRIYKPPFPRILECINTAVMAIDEMMLQNVCNELDYGLDVCPVTEGAHIEHL